MGHFGPRPIRFAWYGLVLPTLVLNYAGQTAVVVDGAVGAGGNPFFALCPAALQLALVAAGDGRNDHRQPGDHQRRVFDDAAGDPARIMSAPAHRPDLGGRLRPDLYRLCQLDADGADARPDAWFPLIRQSRCRIRNRRLADHAADVDTDVPGDAGNLGLEPAGQSCRRRLVRHRRSGVCQRQHDEGTRGRLVPAGRRRARVLPDVYLAAGPRRAAAKARTRHLPLVRFHRSGSQQDACAGYRRSI